MSNPKHISEVMHQLILDNPSDPFVQILRRCPFIQAEMLRKGYMSLDEISEENRERLANAGLINVNQIKRREEEEK